MIHLPRLLLFPMCLVAVITAGGAADQAARYNGLEPDKFLRRWLVLAPVPAGIGDRPDEDTQKRAFSRDWLAEAGGESAIRPRPGDRIRIGTSNLSWRLINASNDVIDPTEGDQPPESSIAYASAEIEMAAPARAMLALGSDDWVKVWLNGRVIHENWIGRAAQPDSDLVPVEFRQGTNHLLIKIFNKQGPWGFVCRALGSDTLGQRLVSAAGQGDADRVTQLLDFGVPVGSRGRGGLTAAQAARLSGQTAIIELLAARGADVTAPLPAPEVLVDALFNSVFEGETPGAAVLVAQKGKVLFEKGYGFADLSHHARATPETKFRIGSVTKQFIGAAILKLEEEGKLSVNDKLSKYIPDYPRGDEVTLHHLLGHTSGIRSYTGKPDFVDTLTVPIEPEKLIESFKNDPYDFNPGERWSYNNSGYFLLGYIIGKVTGKTYGEYLREAFFEPLGMHDTGVHEASLILEKEATGYMYETGRFKRALNWDMSRAGGAGALYSTVRDLHLWNEALFSNRVLSAATLERAFTPVRVSSDDPSEPKRTGYGYGWAIQEVRGLREIAHAGGLDGFVSYLSRLPEEDFTVVVLVNCSPPHPGASPPELARQVMTFYLSDKMKPRDIPKVNQAVSTTALDAFVGRYDYGSGAILSVTREGDALFAQLTGQAKHQIFPKSDRVFFWKVVEAEVEFQKDASGKVTGAIHRQGGATIRARRLEDVTTIELEPAVLDSYVGRYDYGGGRAIMTFSREGKRFFAQLTGQPKFEIFPVSETQFVWKVISAKVTFVKDESGKITKVIHEQGGRKFDAPKLSASR